MQYALMIYGEPGYLETLPDAERAAARADFSALADDARCVGTVQLQPAETATCVRVAGGRTLMTDGPFADTKEVLGGGCAPGRCSGGCSPPDSVIETPEVTHIRYAIGPRAKLELDDRGVGG